MKKLLIILVVIFSTSIVYGYTYEVTNLGHLGGFLGSTPVRGFATAINNSGQVVGTAYDTNGNPRAFIWENGTMRDLGTLGGTSGKALDINSSGQVIGWSRNSSGDPRATKWQNNTIHDLGVSAGTESYAQGINDGGKIVGNVYYDHGREGIDVFLWDNDQFSDLGSGWANDINNSDQVLIDSRYIWENGAKNDLGLQGSVNRADGAFNDFGQVVVELNDEAILWDNGVVTELNTLGGSWSSPNAINNYGVIVGRSQISDSVTESDRGFIWQDDELIDLNSIIPESSGWFIVDARDINDLGQIAAYGRYTDGQFYAILLEPVPIPSAVWLLGSGLVALLGFRKKL